MRSPRDVVLGRLLSNPTDPPPPWVNWAETAFARPVRIERPTSTEEVADAVRRAREEGLTVRMVGSGHSFTGAAVAEGVLLDPTGLVGFRAVDRAAMTVTVLAGTPLHLLNSTLAGLGMALHNMGDIDRQTVAGALSTGTHGTGGVTATFAGQVEAFELVDAQGQVRQVDRTTDPGLFDAGRVSLGALGVLTAITLRTEPAFVLEAVEEPMSWSRAVGEYDALVDAHHHVDMYWFPHTDRCLVKRNDCTLEPAAPLSRARAWVEDELMSNTLFGLVDTACTRMPSITPRVNRVTSRLLGARTYRDAAHRVFVSPRSVVFREMEYSLPREHGMEALTAVRALMEREGWEVPWPVEVRCTPADDAWLSSTYGRESVYLAFHLGRYADHRPYFHGVEALLREYGATRPHWGKLHTRTAADLAPAYPRWADFAAVRERMDPDRVFTNPYLRQVLG